MARPNSKYFASVITKLIAAKRKENIVIDESFKMQLRSDILTRAAGSSSSLEEVRPLDIGAIFARWKYALAVVPSALVVMLIAVQFVNMPVSIPGEQIIPTGSQEASISEGDAQSTEENSIVATDEDDAQDSELALEQTTSNPPVKKLRTFPGALIMPTKLSDDAALETVSFKNEVTNVGSAESVGAESSGDENEASPAPLSLNLFGFNVNIQDEEDTVSAHREERTTHEEPKMNDSDNSVLMADEPSTVMNVQKPATIVHVEDAQKVGAGNVMMAENVVNQSSQDEPLEAQEIPQGIEDEPARAIVGGTMVESVSNIQPASVIESAMPVFRFMEYGVDLQSLERQTLESQVVPSLAAGRTLENVYVSEKENDIVSVEILFENGEKLQKFYRFNKQTQAWDTVQYVTQQYYDNSLTYTTDFVYQVSPY